ncbi:Rz1 lytic protein, partial [Edwardsiella anguillarum]|uniref:Rz1 lytic protein n=1 Tax=Edwardsiella anguillarum TaxID=1821960 RepID=UPI0020131B21
MQSTRSHWSHRELRATSRLLLRAMIALACLFLLALLSGCVNTRTVYVPAPVLPISAELTADTPVPVVPDPLTWGG